MAEVFRIEKTKDFTVMSNHHFKNKNLSLRAKGLLSLMLSLPENWDFSLAGLVKICMEGRDAIRKALKELESEGYLTIEQGQVERGRFGKTQFIIRECPLSPLTENPSAVKSLNSIKSHQTSLPLTENPSAVKNKIPPFTENPLTVNPSTEKPLTENPTQLNTKSIKELKEQNTKSIYLADTDVIVFDEDEIEEILHENIEYDVLTQDPDYFGGTSGTELLDSIVQIIKQPFLSRKLHHRIAGEDIYFEAVRSRFLKLNCEHIKYVYDCVFSSENKQKIKNIQAYLLTALYNAPISCEAYYMAM